MRTAQHAEDMRPVQEDCTCYTCRTFNRAYLRHLYRAGEISALRLGTIHNLQFMANLMRQIREAIAAGTFDAYRMAFLGRYAISNQAVRHQQREKFRATSRNPK